MGIPGRGVARARAAHADALAYLAPPRRLSRGAEPALPARYARAAAPPPARRDRHHGVRIPDGPGGDPPPAPCADRSRCVGADLGAHRAEPRPIPRGAPPLAAPPRRCGGRDQRERRPLHPKARLSRPRDLPGAAYHRRWRVRRQRKRAGRAPRSAETPLRRAADRAQGGRGVPVRALGLGGDGSRRSDRVLDRRRRAAARCARVAAGSREPAREVLRKRLVRRSAELLRASGHARVSDARGRVGTGRERGDGRGCAGPR